MEVESETCGQSILNCSSSSSLPTATSALRLVGIRALGLGLGGFKGVGLRAYRVQGLGFKV